MIILIEDDRRLGMSPSITHGDLAPDKMSSTKLRRVSTTKRNSGTCVRISFSLKFKIRKDFALKKVSVVSN